MSAPPGHAAAPALVRLPPGPALPRAVTLPLLLLARRQTMDALVRRYGPALTLNSPLFGPSVFVTTPDLARQVFLTPAEDLGNIQPNLSRVLGSGSVFALDGEAHRRRRNLLSPPFHGRQVRGYEALFVEETRREIAHWPTGATLPTLPSMMRITLNAILRAVFGAQGQDLARLRAIIPPWVTLGSQLVGLPMPARDYGRFSPWGRLAGYRRQYQQVLDTLIDTARAAPDFAERTDILSVLLRSHCDDGSVLTRKEIGDELMTLLAAGHETTAATLAWVFERLSRQPHWLAELSAEAATDEHTLRRAVIREVQRTRTVIDFAGRHV